MWSSFTVDLNFKNTNKCYYYHAGARCGQAWYMYLITIIVVLTVILVVCGILMVKPALNATHFKPTHCTVDHSQVLKQMTRCTKLSGKVMHTSRFPCLQIYVRYLGDRNNVHTSLLHDTDIQLAEFPKCSFEFCDGSAWLNEQQVLNFQRLHGRHGQMYKCWFNKDDPEEVILRRRYDDPKVAAFHLIFWPVLLIVLTLIGLYVVYKYYGCKLHWTRL
ncbi:unnamed protein product [Owenia fusiformis]|uniref:Uncharacterized protein n=1 Tax=Owenia fusiformis TaxID=6347 RepID=A0A8S4PQ67_OWEFU|nr:unnamed protein product [Owenia fusiformis]